MPNTKSQIERARLSAKEAARNKSSRSTLRSKVKKADASIAANADNKDQLLKEANIALAKAGGKGLVHKKAASRKISRMTKRANSAS